MENPAPARGLKLAVHQDELLAPLLQPDFGDQVQASARPALHIGEVLLAQKLHPGEVDQRCFSRAEQLHELPEERLNEALEDLVVVDEAGHAIHSYLLLTEQATPPGRVLVRLKSRQGRFAFAVNNDDGLDLHGCA